MAVSKLLDNPTVDDSIKSVLKLMIQYGVVREGHFKLTSGRHSGTYINKDALWLYPNLINFVINTFIKLIEKSGFLERCDVITGPALAGSIFAAPISLHFKLPFVYPEKKDDNMVFRRGFNTFLQNKNVIIIEDIITTGNSLLKTANAIEENGGTVVGSFVFWNRTDITFTDFPTHNIIEIPVTSYDPNNCELCKKNEPLTNPKVFK